MTALIICPDCGNPTRSHTGTASANDNGEIVACPLTREHAERLAMVGELVAALEKIAHIGGRMTPTSEWMQNTARAAIARMPK